MCLILLKNYCLAGGNMIRSKVLLKFIISYTVVLLLPLFFISSFIYTRFLNNYTEEVIQSTSRMLIKARDSMDINIRNLNSISAQVSVNQSILPVISYQFRDRLRLYPEIATAIKELNNYKVTNGIIDNLLLFQKDRDTVINNSSKYNATGYFNSVYRWKDTSGEAFCDMLNGIMKGALLPSQTVTSSGDTYNVIAGIYPLPAGSSSPSTLLLITIRESVVQQLVNNALGEFSGHVYILDARDEIVMENAINDGVKENKNQADIVGSFLESIKNEDITVYNKSMGDSILCYVKSEASGWQYVAVMPAGQILSRVNYLRRYYIIVAVVVFVVGLVLVFLFSRGNYRNVKRISDMILTKNHGVVPDNHRNEWNFISRSIHSYISENEALQQKMADQLPAIRNNFLSRLLKGHTQDIEDIKKMAGFLNLKVNFESFFVMLLRLEENGSFNGKNQEDIYSVIKLAISNAAEELCKEWGTGYAVEMDKDRIVLTGMLENLKGNSPKDVSVKIAESIRNFMIKRFKLEMTLAVSDLHSNISEMAAGYAEAEIALDYRIIKSENTIIYYDELDNRKDYSYYYSFEQEQTIISHLRRGDFNSIKEILDQMVNRIKNEPVALEVIKCTYYDLVNTAMKALNELNITGSQDGKDLLNLIHSSTFDKIYEEVSKFYSGLCDYVNNAKSLKNEELGGRILDYIQANFHDSSLSVEMVAGAFSISPSYLSRLFKDQSGCHFIDYVHHLRLKKAKELLASSGEGIAVIAEKTGYNSLYNFTRVFKRYEGVTPSEYRNSKCSIQASS